MIFPRPNWRVDWVPTAAPKPVLSYINQDVPRSIFMRRNANSYLTSGMFDTIPGIYATSEQDLAHMDVPHFTAMLKASRNVTLILRFLTMLPDLPDVSSIAAKAPPLTAPIRPPPETRGAVTCTPNSLPSSRQKRKPYRNDPILSHDFRNISHKCRAFARITEPLQKNMIIAKRFQEEYTKSWNQTVDDVAQMIFLPMSPHDEITTSGSMQMYIELLNDFRLTDRADDGEYRPADDIDNQLLYLWGDAMDKVVEMQGDLHLGMHMLAVIFKKFYAGNIQVAQSILRWKRIQFNPLPRYQQSRAIIRLMTDELERLRMVEWVEELGLLEIPSEIVARYHKNAYVSAKLKAAYSKERGTTLMALDDVSEILSAVDQIIVRYRLDSEMACHWQAPLRRACHEDDRNELRTVVDKSTFISLLRRCAQSVGAIGLSRAEARSSQEPERVRERRALYQLFAVAKVWTAIKGRKLSDDFLWKYEEELITLGDDLCGTSEDADVRPPSEQVQPQVRNDDILDADPEADGDRTKNSEQAPQVEAVSDEDMADRGMTDEEKDEIVRDLAKMKRFRMEIAAATKDIDVEGRRLLGDNVAEDRLRKKSTDERKRLTCD